MAGVSFPIPKRAAAGRALIVGNPQGRGTTLAAMQALGFDCAELDNPYAATAELLKRPLVYRALVLSLSSLYREEIAVIGTVRRRLPHVDIWLAHTEGRQAAMVEALRLGAAGLLAEDGALHRIAGQAEEQPPTPSPQPQSAAPEPADSEPAGTEPLLSADELRALLEEQPANPPTDVT